MAPPDTLELARTAGVSVVTQPSFIYERGDTYLQEVESRDRPWLYRCRAFLDAGIKLAAGTDAPFGDPDPWRSMKAAVERRSRSGTVLGSEEALTPEQALALFTCPASDPGGDSRKIELGERADLCLLNQPWKRVRETLSKSLVRATICNGKIIYG